MGHDRMFVAAMGLGSGRSCDAGKPKVMDQLNYGC